MKKVFQLFDEQGNPAGGHVIMAPDEATMASSIAECLAGHNYTEVSDESVIIAPPPPSEEPVI